MATDHRPSSFQPEKPHPQTNGGDGESTTYVVVGAVAAVMAIMVLAIAAPRFLEGNWRWVFVLGTGALVFLGVVGVGFLRRSS